MDPVAILAKNETFAPQPDLLVLLRVSPATALERIARRGDGNGNLFEQRTTLERCAEIFDAIHRPYLFAVDGELAPDVLHAAIIRKLDEGPIFRVLCHKPHLDACDPYLCEYRIKGLCEYPGLPLLRPDPGIDIAEINRIADGPGTTEEKMARVAEILGRHR